MSTSTITIHMVASLDGIIAKPDNSVAWFETTDDYPKGAESPDTAAFFNTIDCYVMGARTYEHAMALAGTHGWPYGDTPTVVVSSKEQAISKPNIRRYSGDPGTLAQELRLQYRNIWVVGGAPLTREFIRMGLADEIRMMLLPILLGEGLLFFDHIGREQLLHLKDVTPYRNGMIDLCYEIKK